MKKTKQVKRWYAKIGEKGGRSKSPKKISAVTKNIMDYHNKRRAEKMVPKDAPILTDENTLK